MRNFLGIEVTPRKKKKEFISSEEKRPRGRPRKKRRPSEADYLMHRPMKRERLRADPLVSISSIFEKILTDLRTALVNDIDIFMKPVDKKTVADYYDVIQNPISIQDWNQNPRHLARTLNGLGVHTLEAITFVPDSMYSLYSIGRYFIFQ